MRRSSRIIKKSKTEIIDNPKTISIKEKGKEEKKKEIDGTQLFLSLDQNLLREIIHHYRDEKNSIKILFLLSKTITLHFKQVLLDFIIYKKPIKFTSFFKIEDLLHIYIPPDYNLEFTPNYGLKKLFSLFDFNQYIEYFPDSLDTLSLCGNFNQRIKKFPKNLVHLYFGGFFSQKIPILPETLRTLKIGSEEIYSIENLPKKLENLKVKVVGCHTVPEFVQYSCFILNNIKFLDKLKKLEIDGKFNIDIQFPKNIEVFKLGSNTKECNIKNLPENLQKFTSTGIPRIDINLLPKKLIYLELYKYTGFLENLPETLRTLKIGMCFDTSVDKLPYNLEYLNLGNDFNQSVDSLPSSLLELKLGRNFNQSIDNLPDTLTYLEIYGNFNQPINKFPNSLEFLKIGYSFNNFLHCLPKGLKYLHLGFSFNQILVNLPDSLTCLEISNKYYDKCIDNLPFNLETLRIHKNCKVRLGDIPPYFKRIIIDGEKDEIDPKEYKRKRDISYNRTLTRWKNKDKKKKETQEKKLLRSGVILQ